MSTAALRQNDTRRVAAILYLLLAAACVCGFAALIKLARGHAFPDLEAAVLFGTILAPVGLAAAWAAFGSGNSLGRDAQLADECPNGWHEQLACSCSPDSCSSAGGHWQASRQWHAIGQRHTLRQRHLGNVRWPVRLTAAAAAVFASAMLLSARTPPGFTAWLAGLGGMALATAGGLWVERLLTGRRLPRGAARACSARRSPLSPGRQFSLGGIFLGITAIAVVLAVSRQMLAQWQADARLPLFCLLAAGVSSNTMAVGLFTDVRMLTRLLSAVRLIVGPVMAACAIAGLDGGSPAIWLPVFLAQAALLTGVRMVVCVARQAAEISFHRLRDPTRPNCSVSKEGGIIDRCDLWSEP